MIGSIGSQSQLTINSSLTQSVAYSQALEQLTILSPQRQVEVSNVETSATTGYKLYQNLPNPFADHTIIRFAIPEKQLVRLTIYNTLSQAMKTFKGEYPAGEHQIVWDGKGDTGLPVGSGAYYYQMSAARFTKAKRIILR